MKYYVTTLVKSGPRVGIRVWYGYPIDPVTSEILTERSPQWRCEINGTPTPIEDIAFAIGASKIYGTPRMVAHDSEDGQPSIVGDPIDEAEYVRLTLLSQWAENVPNHPHADVRKPIDHLKHDTVF